LQKFLNISLTWNLYNFFVSYQIQLIENGIVFRQIFIATLLLFAAEDGTIDCKRSKKKSFWKGEENTRWISFECHLQLAANKVEFLVHWFLFVFTRS
jgi:hypothetical protein